MAPVKVGVVFSLGFAETEPGEEICLTGSGAVLGGWNPDQAVSLQTDAATYPKWSTAVLWFCLPSDASFPLRLEYKYLRDRRKLGGDLAWEDSIPNRSVDISPCDPEAAWLVHDLSWGSSAAVLTKSAGSFTCKHLPASKPQPDMGLRRQISPEWSGGHDVISDASEADFEGDNFTPTVRIAYGAPEDVEAQTLQMAREESATSLHHWSASSLPECQNEEPEPEGIADHAVVAEKPSTGLRKNNSVSLLPSTDGDNLLNQNKATEAADKLSPTATALAFEAAYAIIGEKPIGEGSFGLVWSCRLRNSNTDLRAVKRIKKALLKPRDIDNLFGREGFEGEISMHLRLKHPHVVAMHQVFNAPGIVSLVMECCQGGDLFDLISASRVGLPEAGAARALRHLLSALAFLHGKLIVHRDVKCENVLCSERGLPAQQSTFKLCDFGFAASLKTADGTLQTRLGSPDAVAPEVVAGKKYSTPVDCWAAGVLLYMALSASSPFWDKTDTEVLRKVKAGEYKLSGPRWERISREAKDVVRLLLTYNPAVRITAARALETRWVCGDPFGLM